MSHFFAKHRLLVGSILGLFVLTTGFLIWRAVIFHTPLDVPIELSMGGRIEQGIWVGMDATHQIDFVFTNVSRSKEDAARLIGGSRFSSSQTCEPQVCDIAVPIRWSLADASGQIIHSAETDTHGMFGWAAPKYWRNVAQSIYLDRGSYHLRAEIMHDVPEADGIAARLTLTQGGGKPRTWQGALSFIGSGVLLIVVPLEVLLLVILLIFWSSERRRQF